MKLVSRDMSPFDQIVAMAHKVKQIPKMHVISLPLPTFDLSLKVDGP